MLCIDISEFLSHTDYETVYKYQPPVLNVFTDKTGEPHLLPIICSCVKMPDPNNITAKFNFERHNVVF